MEGYLDKKGWVTIINFKNIIKDNVENDSSLKKFFVELWNENDISKNKEKYKIN